MFFSTPKRIHNRPKAPVGAFSLSVTLDQIVNGRRLDISERHQDHSAARADFVCIERFGLLVQTSLNAPYEAVDIKGYFSSPTAPLDS